ncbi:helix-turn-helix domain-containing protein [Streptomyces sp. CBMA29]|uniref:helix-turn-helix domain-containing protein n=1 Tax=Streptomyces sp. CBMA29 TaxID=1896314 RepID=UPI001661B101|nr:helix-turn-helix transcriptional regulator [Streptomyces sp. CBMA29]MBD0734038.1 hypothetical protein [Streptomyces sp. CBMA29]
MPVKTAEVRAMSAFAVLLKQLRAATGLDQPTAAERLGFTGRHRLSYLERGRGWPSDDELTAMLDLYTVAAENRDAFRQLIADGKRAGGAWWDSYLAYMSRSLEQLIDYESMVEHICTASSSAVPGWLQTRAYTEALFAFRVEERGTDRTSALIEVRQRRGEELFSQPALLGVHVLITEGVLRTVVGGTQAMQGQLAHLRWAALRKDVTFQILPFSAGAATALCGDFSILEFGDTRPTVLHSDVGDAISFEEKREEVALGQRRFSALSGAALDSDDSLALLEEIRKGL